MNRAVVIEAVRTPIGRAHPEKGMFLDVRADDLSADLMKALLEKVNHWTLEALVYTVDQYRHEVAQLIEHTVGQWDPEATSEKIELQIGRDLQFVRINGTLVGGLVGLVLYTISQWF